MMLNVIRKSVGGGLVRFRLVPHPLAHPFANSVVSFSNRIRTISASRSLFQSISSYYRVEVSNAERPESTKLTIRGPDHDGIMASMTVALAKEGCSLKELHAGYLKNAADTFHYENQVGGNEIEDIFFVVQQETGKQFPDDELHGLGSALLESLDSPMTCLSGKDEGDTMDRSKLHEGAVEGAQITVVKSKD